MDLATCNCAMFASMVSTLILVMHLLFAVGSAQQTKLEFHSACSLRCFQTEQCAVNSYRSETTILERLAGWNCYEDCKYQCMWKTENEFIVRARQAWTLSHLNPTDKALADELVRAVARAKPVKYDGKYPFKRRWGIQEPMSVLGSLMNLLAHVSGFVRYQSTRRLMMPQVSKAISSSWFLHRSICAYFWISVVTWICSSVFHVHEVTWTRSLDYGMAMANLLVMLNVALVQAFHVVNQSVQTAILMTLALLWVAHSSYMNLISFDFGWNMKLGVIVGAVAFVLMITWSLAHLIRPVCKRIWPSRVNSRSHYWILLLAMILSILVTVAHAADFAPVTILEIDAHAFWHLSTAFPSYLIYLFWSAELMHSFDARKMLLLLPDSTRRTFYF